MERNHPIEQIVQASHFVASRLAIRGWSELPRPTQVTPTIPENIILGEE